MRNFGLWPTRAGISTQPVPTSQNHHEHRTTIEMSAWQDLRLHDNETLVAAARDAKASGGQLAFLYVHSPDEDGDDPATGVRT